MIDHPDVAEVAVVPMPDPDLGERAFACVQPRTGKTLTFVQIIAYLRSRKASVLQPPERIEFISILPHTKAEKVDKRALRDDVKKKLTAPGWIFLLFTVNSCSMCADTV